MWFHKKQVLQAVTLGPCRSMDAPGGKHYKLWRFRKNCHVDGDRLWPLLRCVLPNEGPGSRQSGPSMCIFSGRGFAICRTSM